MLLAGVIQKSQPDRTAQLSKFLVLTGELGQEHFPFENFVSYLTDPKSAEIFVHTSLPYQNFIQKDLWHKVHYSLLRPLQKQLQELIKSVHNYAVLKDADDSLEVEPISTNLLIHFPKFTNWSSVTR